MKAITGFSRYSIFIALAAAFALSMSTVPSAVAAEEEVANVALPDVVSHDIDSIYVGILDDSFSLETPSTSTPALTGMRLRIVSGRELTTKNLDAITVQHASQGNASSVPCPEGRTGMLGVNLKQPFFEGKTSRRVELYGTFTNQNGQSQNFSQVLLDSTTNAGTPQVVGDQGIQILSICSKA